MVEKGPDPTAGSLPNLFKIYGIKTPTDTATNILINNEEPNIMAILYGALKKIIEIKNNKDVRIKEIKKLTFISLKKYLQTLILESKTIFLISKISV